MKKIITPFLLGLMLALSSATVLADSSPTQQNHVGGASLSSVLRSYDNNDVQFLALAENKTIADRGTECLSVCGGRPDFEQCMKLCKMGN